MLYRCEEPCAWCNYEIIDVFEIFYAIFNFYFKLLFIQGGYNPLKEIQLGRMDMACVLLERGPDDAVNDEVRKFRYMMCIFFSRGNYFECRWLS